MSEAEADKTETGWDPRKPAREFDDLRRGASLPPPRPRPHSTAPPPPFATYLQGDSRSDDELLQKWVDAECRAAYWNGRYRQLTEGSPATRPRRRLFGLRSSGS